MSRILVVEDEAPVQQFLAAVLKDHALTLVGSVDEALHCLEAAAFDLVLLDLQLGDDSGIRVARALRQRSPHTALVILTGHGSLATAVEAIALQVQAYLLKPIKPAELRTVVAEQLLWSQDSRRRERLAAAMAQAIAQAQEDEGPTRIHQQGSLLLDRERYDARYNGQDLNLTAAQFRVLWVLVRAGGQPVLSAVIAEEALGYSVGAIEATGLVKGYISHLRRKLAACFKGADEHIMTIRGEGYMWVDEV